MATKHTLEGIKSNVMACLGKRVILKTNQGKRNSRVNEGVIEKVFPCVFTVRVDHGQETERTLSYSYSDILTNTVEVQLFKSVKDLS